MKRYFIVFYQYLNMSNGHGVGQLNCSTLDFYPNKKDMTSQLGKKIRDYKYNSLVFTNIIELNESDYKDFVKE